MVGFCSKLMVNYMADTFYRVIYVMNITSRDQMVVLKVHSSLAQLSVYIYIMHTEAKKKKRNGDKKNYTVTYTYTNSRTHAHSHTLAGTHMLIFI